ncbi:hypothetical protein ACIPJ2_01070 [Curtobacterium sp. NPDC090217]|uniref:hypothetical protein n=1 Tax=Curtobacterium sp. NPDC090217 TaxID=3363970 RepID=UPI003802F9F5
MGEQRARRPGPARPWIVAGAASGVIALAALVSPLRSSVTGNVPVWFLAVVLLATGAWFVVYAVIARPRRAGDVPLDPEATSMPRDPAIYDPADYEPRAGYVTDVSGRTNTTPISVVVAVVAGFATLFVCGAFAVGRVEAYGLATIVAVVTAQVWSLTGRR